MKPRKILVPLDGSEMAELALAQAVQLTGSPPATLILLRAAIAGVMPANVIEAQVHVVREAEEYLDGVKARLAKQGVPNVEAHVWYGAAAPSIVEAVDLHKVDLIVMSTHGRSGLGRLVFGSVAESVLRGTTVPILLIRPTGAPVELPTGQARPASALDSKRTEALR
jgi:nucleotide-binding universal stress UspA family protein